MYRAYMEFFELAERRRRWSVFEDIPWEKVDEAPRDDDAALCAETFCGVEMYLPDYVSQGVNVLRSCFGQAWFATNWGYEESKHALTLRKWLIDSGHRTEEEFAAFEQAVLSSTWKAPFTTPRQLACYGAIQEQATFVIYRKQLEQAQARGDVVLAAIYGHIAKDEAAHAAFYRDVIALELEEDRDGTLSDLAHTFAHFRMPGVGLVPDYDARVGVMRSAGIDRGVFLQRVWMPTMKGVGITRADLLGARRRADAGIAAK
ncbi:MAG: acyl-ACP desaturase [Alphaproteobacteria bacterium]|nr:acyl-ACP desaturase [Alphaproteobacteria bacterium]